MTYRVTACRCHQPCRYCAGARDAAAVKAHNQRVACCGERAYPAPQAPAAPINWLEELLRG